MLLIQCLDIDYDPEDYRIIRNYTGDEITITDKDGISYQYIVESVENVKDKIRLHVKINSK